LPSASIIGPKRRRSRISKRRSSIARIASTRSRNVWPSVSRGIQRSMEATASAARTLSPSWKRGPSRSVKVQRSPSSSTTCPSQSCGRMTNSASGP
jgi:hypothetical protein